MTDIEIRVAALNAAVRHAPTSWSSKGTVAMAQEFERYLRTGQ